MNVYYHPDQALHRPRFFLQRGQVRANVETPERAGVLLAAVRALGLKVLAPRAAERTALEAVHAPAYLDFLATAWERWQAQGDAGPEIVPNMHPVPDMAIQGAGPRPGAGPVAEAGWFMADTACPIGAQTGRAAFAAAACALAGARALLAGERAAYALCRPPGHHAYAARAGGHCYLNNAALAAQALRAGGAPRMAVLDIDVHHGNGTQAIFWQRPDVFVASIHADPSRYYPWYVGHADERGGGAGEGFTLNLPLPLGTGDADWLAALDHALAALAGYDPPLLVVSLGLDASAADPLKGFAVSEEGFARAGARIAAFGRPTLLVQEGGYPSPALGACLGRFLDGFLGGAAGG